MDKKKVTIGIISVLLAGVAIFCLVWCIINFNAVKDGISGTGLYTQEDLENAYNEGLEKALEKEKYYQEQLEQARADYVVLVDNFNKKSQELNSALEQNEQDIEMINTLQTEKTELEADITNLEAEINRLNDLVSYYESLIADIETEDCRAMLYADSHIFNVIIAKTGSSIKTQLSLVQAPIKEGYQFVGWSFEENGTLIDLDNDELIINNNISIYAVYEDMRTWQTIYDDNVDIVGTGVQSTQFVLNIEDLKQTDIIKVNFSRFAIQSGNVLDMQTFYFKNTAEGIKLTKNYDSTDTEYKFSLNLNETIKYIEGSITTLQFTVNCFEDGKLQINFNYTVNGLVVYPEDIRIESVQVFR